MKDFSKPASQNDGQLRDAPDLVFPDWSGMVSHKVPMTFQQAVRWNEEIHALFRPKPYQAALDADARCYVEFKLLGDDSP